MRTKIVFGALLLSVALCSPGFSGECCATGGCCPEPACCAKPACCEKACGCEAGCGSRCCERATPLKDLFAGLKDLCACHRCGACEACGKGCCPEPACCAKPACCASHLPFWVLHWHSSVRCRNSLLPTNFTGFVRRNKAARFSAPTLIATTMPESWNSCSRSPLSAV